MILETERLILRPWRADDADALFEYAKDPAVGYPAGWPAHTSIEESRRIITFTLSRPETYAITLKPSDKAIGCISIKRGQDTDMTDEEDEGEIGYWLGVPFWGKGIMPEAVREIQRRCFEDLGVNTIWCGYYEGNEKSRKVQEKCGFVHHHVTKGSFLPLLNETRTGHVTVLTKEAWIASKAFLDRDSKSVFERIYEQVRSIPEGKVATYGQIASLAGNPRWSRVVGFALHVNPEPGVIPCHRVVDRHGRLSPAFAFGGINMQEKLLKNEGVEVIDGAVDLEKYRF